MGVEVTLLLVSSKRSVIGEKQSFICMKGCNLIGADNLATPPFLLCKLALSGPLRRDTRVENSIKHVRECCVQSARKKGSRDSRG